MFCNKCGNAVPDGNKFCGVCGATVEQSVPVQNNASPVREEKIGFFKTPGKGSKSYAAIMSALMVFPATFCVAIDMVFQRSDGWSFYVVGALITAWVVLVYPILNITPAPVTALICFFAVIGYITYIAGKAGFADRLYKVGLPLLILAAIFIAVDSALIGSKKFGGIHLFSLISLESAIFLVAIEATVDNLHSGVVDLRWSMIFAGFFISVIALIEAISYVVKLNSKK